MTVSKTTKGRYNIYTSSAATTSNVISELVQALNDDSMHAVSVIYFNTTDKTAVAEVGR